MQKKKAARLAGFIGALCASGALVGIGVAGTGAYFSASNPGSFTASSGHLTLNTSATNFSYANLMPGTPVSKTVNYTVNASSGQVDLWLVFDTSTAANKSAYNFFTGGKYEPGSQSQVDPNTCDANGNCGGLGRYGYFAVSESHAGTVFQSGNLSFYDSTNNTQSPSSCTTDAVTGDGGSQWIATAGDSQPTEYCGVPQEIRLANGLAANESGSVTLTLGLDGYLQTQQNQMEFDGGTVAYHIVATQHGQTP